MNILVATIQGPETLGESIGFTLFALLMSVGLIAYAIIASRRFRRIKKSDDWIRTDAELCEITEEVAKGDDEIGMQYQGIYQYHSMTDGENYFYHASQVYRNREKVPKTLEMWYNCKAPDNAVIKNTFFQIVAFIVGLIFAGFTGCCIYWIFTNWFS